MKKTWSKNCQKCVDEIYGFHESYIRLEQLILLCLHMIGDKLAMPHKNVYSMQLEGAKISTISDRSIGSEKHHASWSAGAGTPYPQ